MAFYTVVEDNTVILYLPGQDQYPQYFWKDTSKTDPVTAAGDLIRRVDNGFVGGGTNWRSYGDTTTNRPELGSDGGVQFSGALAGNGGNPAALDIASSTAILNAFTTYGYVDIGLMFKPNSSYGFKSRPMIDNTNFNGTARGIFAGTQAADTTHSKFQFYMNNGTSRLIDLLTPDYVESNSWHRARVHLEPGNGKSWVQVDKGTKTYGTITGSLSTISDNAATNVYLGTRATIGSSVTFEGQLKNVRIGTAWGAASEANWLLDSPVGDITGDPELASANIHLNLNKTYYYCPRFIYFNGQQISDPTDSDGAVYRWTVPNDAGGAWVGSGHGADDIRGVETVISAIVSVDGASSTLTNGEQYSGGSVSMTRETSTIAYSSQVQTVTVSGNAKYEHIRMVRNSTSGTFGRTYPIRNTRAPSFIDYLALGIDGQELESGTTNAADGSEHFMPQGTWALAQWSSSLNVMALIVMTNGWRDDPNYLLLINDTPQNKRVYQTVIGYAPSAGTVLEMGSVTKFYDTTEEEWEDLAASELQAMLATAPGGRRGMGLGLGMSYGARRF